MSEQDQMNFNVPSGAAQTKHDTKTAINSGSARETVIREVSAWDAWLSASLSDPSIL